jgi:hypothetical protein
MMTKQHSDLKPVKPEPDLAKTKLGKLAQKIDPSSREISDQDLKDPGRMTPDTPPTKNRS